MCRHTYDIDCGASKQKNKKKDSQYKYDIFRDEQVMITYKKIKLLSQRLLDIRRNSFYQNP